MGGLAAMTEATQQLFKYGETALALYRTANLLEDHHRAYIAELAPYGGADRFEAFGARIESVRTSVSRELLAPHSVAPEKS